MDKSTKIALCLLLGLVLVPGKLREKTLSIAQGAEALTGICSIFRTIDSLALNNPDVTWAMYVLKLSSHWFLRTNCAEVLL